jgi:hypothetical protein
MDASGQRSRNNKDGLGQTKEKFNKQSDLQGLNDSFGKSQNPEDIRSKKLSTNSVISGTVTTAALFALLLGKNILLKNKQNFTKRYFSNY